MVYLSHHHPDTVSNCFFLAEKEKVDNGFRCKQSVDRYTFDSGKLYTHTGVSLVFIYGHSTGNNPNTRFFREKGNNHARSNNGERYCDTILRNVECISFPAISMGDIPSICGTIVATCNLSCAKEGIL